MKSRIAARIAFGAWIGLGPAFAFGFHDRVEVRGPHDKPEVHTSSNAHATAGNKDKGKGKKAGDAKDDRGHDPQPHH